MAGGGQLEPELVAGRAKVAQLTACADRFVPAEDFLDQLTTALAVAAAGVPRRSARYVAVSLQRRPRKPRGILG